MFHPNLEIISNQKKYNVVIPVRNEELYIGQMLESIINQTQIPSAVFVVNDNSTDRTQEIINSYSKKYPFINYVDSGSKSNTYEPGSKIINAFYKGFEAMTNDWDIIFKLDGDLVLPLNYFEKVIAAFDADDKVGIAGGVIYIEKNGEWTFEDVKNKNLIRGALKSYTKVCFEKIGGIRRTIGWDTLDEMIAQYHGFKIKVLPDLVVKLQKPTGTDYKKIHAQKTGQGFYKMDYGLFISLIAAAKDSWKKRKISVFFSIMKGYFKSALNSDSKAVTKEEGRYIRKLRRQGILGRLGIKK